MALTLNIPVSFFFFILVVSYFHCQSYGKEILENLHTWHETRKSQLSSDVTCSIKPLNPPVVGLNFPVMSVFLVFISIIALFNTGVLGLNMQIHSPWGERVCYKNLQISMLT